MINRKSSAIILLIFLLSSCASVPHVGNGGWLIDAQSMAWRVIINGDKLCINENKNSASVIAIELIHNMRPDLVGIGPRAAFGFHQGRRPDSGIGWEYFSVAHHFRQEVVDWVDANGGWPEGYPATYIYYDDLVKFYRTCE